MGFSSPTMWMNAGFAVPQVTITYSPGLADPVINKDGLVLLRPTTPVSAPRGQVLKDSFSITPTVSVDGAPTLFTVTFTGRPESWYWTFKAGRQVSIPIAFGSGLPEFALLPLNAVELSVLWGNPALYPLSTDGRMHFVPADLEAKDIEFYAPSFGQALALNAKGALELPKGARIPHDLVQKPFELEIRVKDQPPATVPVQLRVGTDLIVMFDRSRSMDQLNPKTQASKWSAARDAAHLLSDLYGGALTDLRTPGGVRLLDEQRIAFGQFYAHHGSARTIIDPFRPASGERPLLSGEVSPRGGAALGDALLTAHAAFGKEGSKRRRRHIVVLTDSTDIGITRPLVDIGPKLLPTTEADPAFGVTVHHVAYGLPAEAQSVDLHALSRVYGGQFHDSASDLDPLDPGELHTMFLSVLADVLPLQRTEARGASCVAIEDGVQRAIFVALGQGQLCATNGYQSTTGTRSSGAFSYATVEQPDAGIWAISEQPPGARVIVLLESTLRMRSGVEQHGLGKPITVWAELHHGLAPISGANVRANASLPAESLGELLTSFAQSGELIRASRCRHVEPHLLEAGGGLLATARALRVVSPAPAPRNAAEARPDPDTHDLGPRDEPRAPQRELLDSVERARNLPFQSRRQQLHLNEVRPGRYEAQLPAADAQHEGAYTFRLRADGTTPDGLQFARDQRLSTVLAPVPDPERTVGWVVRDGDQRHSQDGMQHWIATFLPRTRLDKPVGPGLIRNLSVHYADDCEDGTTRPLLQTHDNLDGTYSARFETREVSTPPALALHYRIAGGGPALASAVLRGPNKLGKRVRVTLNEVRVPDLADACLVPDKKSQDTGKLHFDVIVAVNGNPNRATRTHVSKAWSSGQETRREIETSEHVFDGFVEQGAALDIAIGEPGFDWMQLFNGRPLTMRYRQIIRLVEHEDRSHAVALFEEPDQPGRQLWKVWLTVDVQ
jgi:hypothetical protein